MFVLYWQRMPNVRTHDLITTLSGAALLPLSWLLLPSRSLTLALTISTAHWLAGLIFSPDLDIFGTNYRRWGPLRVLWWPYAKTIPHRSWLSHGLIVGPLLQLVYFVAVFGGLAAVLLLLVGQHSIWNEFVRWLLVVGSEYPALVVGFLGGFITGSASHSIPDWLSTGTKRTWNRLFRF